MEVLVTGTDPLSPDSDGDGLTDLEELARGSDSSRPNKPPIADAGPDVVVEAAFPTGVVVSLDGSGTFDPEEDRLTLTWDAPGIVFDNLISETPLALFPLGTTTVSLT